tara:strand:- start:129782 stop:130117 length:336 start_codon:yes stop_codon:yes gene_type:complete
MNYLQLMMIYKDHPIIKDNLISSKQLEVQVVQIYNELKRKVERSDIRFYDVGYSLCNYFELKPDFNNPVTIRGLENLNTDSSVLNKVNKNFIYFIVMPEYTLGIKLTLTKT